MKKLMLSIFLMTSALSYGQYMLGKGEKQLNVGFGFSSWGLPVYIGMDFGVGKDISLGAELSFRSYSDKWHDVKYKHSIIGISGNANYHFNSLLNIPEKFDFYAGLNVGFYYWTSDADYIGDNTSGLGLGGQLGFRYYWNERMAINIEGGGGNAFSGGKIGITIKF